MELEDTIIGIENFDGVKFVHFYGYGYIADDNGDGKDCRFLEYCGMYAPLSEVLVNGFLKAEQDRMESVKEYIRDCTEEECMEIYNHYDNGSAPEFINESDIDMDTPCGIYIVRYLGGQYVK